LRESNASIKSCHCWPHPPSRQSWKMAASTSSA